MFEFDVIKKIGETTDPQAKYFILLKEYTELLKIHTERLDEIIVNIKRIRALEELLEENNIDPKDMEEAGAKVFPN